MSVGLNNHTSDNLIIDVLIINSILIISLGQSSKVNNDRSSTLRTMAYGGQKV